jgi:hypothetical protein
MIPKLCLNVLLLAFFLHFTFPASSADSINDRNNFGMPVFLGSGSCKDSLDICIISKEMKAAYEPLRLSELLSFDSFYGKALRGSGDAKCRSNLTDIDELVNAITSDDEGNLYATLVRDPSDYMVAKYDKAGCLSWVLTYDGPGGGDDFVKDIAVDAKGNVYVTGTSMGDDNNFDYATLKYSRNGRRFWVQRYDGPGKGNDIANAIAVDASGNVYVTGTSLDHGSDYNFATLKYSADGRQIWVRHYTGPGNGIDMGEAVSVDKEGNVHVLGLSLAADGSEQYASVKYDPLGKELQVKRFTAANEAGGEPT